MLQRGSSAGTKIRPAPAVETVIVVLMCENLKRFEPLDQPGSKTLRGLFIQPLENTHHPLHHTTPQRVTVAGPGAICFREPNRTAPARDGTGVKPRHLIRLKTPSTLSRKRMRLASLTESI